MTARMIFVNLPVRDLKRSMEFFSKLGFEFNRQFTDDKAACMVVSQQAFVMLLVHDRFRDFAKRPIADATQSTGGIYALSCSSRAEVDELVHRALAAGGSQAADPIVHGDFMYGWSFFDLDGHHWDSTSAT